MNILHTFPIQSTDRIRVVTTTGAVLGIAGLLLSALTTIGVGTASSAEPTDEPIVIGPDHSSWDTPRGREPFVIDLDHRRQIEIWHDDWNDDADDDGDNDDDETRGGVRWDAAFDYHRVDGLAVGLIQRIRGHGPRAPRITLSEMRAFHRGRWLFGVEFEKPLVAGGPTVGGGFFRRTAMFADLDGERIDSVENSLAALFIKKDFRDYFEEEGLGVFVRQPLGSVAHIEARVVRSEHRPLDNSIRTSLMRWDDDFRPNPQAAEGAYRALQTTVEFDTRTRSHSPDSGQWLRIHLDRADHGLGGDFEFTRLLVDLRQYLRTNPGQRLHVRTIFGRGLDGTLPPQKRFAIGGVGTLRAHEFKELIGSSVFLANAEYSFEFVADTFAMVFLDTGATASDGDSLEDRVFALDGGIGFGIADERAAIYLARDLRKTSADLQVSLRLTSTF